MQKIKRHSIALAVLCTLLFAACVDEPLADRIVGKYSGTSTAYEYRLKDTVVNEIPQKVWSLYRTTETKNEDVYVVKVDDNTVNVATKSSKWGDGTFDNVALSGYSNMVNLKGNGTMSAGSPYPAGCKLNGSVNTDNRQFMFSTVAESSAGRLAISFSNK